jgi:hypothetical protein
MKVLILADQSQRIRSQINLLKELCKKRRNIVITLIVDCINEDKVFQSIQNLKNVNIIYIIPSKKLNKDDKGLKKKGILHKFIKYTSVGQFFYFFIQFVKMFRYVKKADTIITHEKPDVIILNGDRRSVSLEQAFLKKSIQKSIRTIIPYTCVMSNGISIRLLDINSFRIKTLFDKFVFNFFRHITKKVENEEIIFYDASSTLVLSLFGTLSKNPWLIGNGLSDIVCIDNNFSFNKYQNDMLFPSKFKIIGDIEYDSLYINSNLEKDNFYNKYNIKIDKEIVIVALPQLAEHLILSWKEHWAEINFIMEELNKFDLNLLISLHPKMDIVNYYYLESKYNCRILDEELKIVLSYSDLFIASNSSTVIWSTILGIKTIIVNYYGLDVSFFNGIKSIRYINKKEFFYQSIQELLNEEIDFNDDFNMLSKNEVFDGKTIERYYLLLKGKK